MEAIVLGGSLPFLPLSSCQDLLRITQQKWGKSTDILYMKEKAWEICVPMCKRMIGVEAVS